ncbi:Penicillin-binding protein [Candidatus Sulfotelmatomonas gaucii]|uniref:Penicillin-binding protein n=1 Tax=Candidatus Sulfuritelmatomonas gaucii TaxID=2043161 RepID=A0A2N9L9A5_9BACT|nr:Penicillin-binding protein [Candidatus Sulfotelmatomonas gaucii]
MTLRVRLARPEVVQHLRMRILLVLLGLFVVAVLVGFSIFGFLYVKYQHVVDDRLKQPMFAKTAKIYAAPREVRPGQKLTVHLIADELRQGGYTPGGAPQASELGTYNEGVQQITIQPGPQSYHAPDSATIHVSSGVVDGITDARGQQLSSYELEPLLITGLSEGVERTKRRLLTYDEIPPNLVHAVIAIEDRRFFEHGGIDYVRIIGAFRNDIFHLHRYEEGASTLTQQLARGFFLTPERTYSRKIREAVISIILEHRFTKQQIFAMYANEINLGQLGSFSIDGFGEAAQAYFGKDVSQLDLSQCALLAGIIQSPSRLNPFRHADRAIERRNLVLDSMVDVGSITKEQAEAAKVEPLRLAPASVDESEAPYFVDLVHDQLTQRLGDRDFNREGLRIYTSLDPDLQRIATQAVDSTIHVVDEQVDHLHARDRKLGKPYVYPQVALIALDPHTGQVLALVGGRSYGTSQVNHAVAHRPTGSVFKPFVYAAAFQTAVQGTLLPGQTKLFSPVTMLDDAQNTYGEGTPYEYTPRNYKGEFYGEMTARLALMRSDNNATIGLASMIGFDQVAALARDAGIKSAQGTPSMAIGSYDATPLDMAGAYTIFSNGGIHIDPWMLASVRTVTGDIIDDYSPTTRQVLDPRVAFLTTYMMEAVLQGNGPNGCLIGGRDFCGTGAGVRNMGFLAPAAGKTGTSHDAWFAGFTSNLLCVVWVGNDDYTNIDLEGAHAAAPIWADFMKQAIQLPQYSDTNDFTPPQGIDIVTLDRNTNLLADAACADDYTAAFLDGTAPTDTCDHPPDHRNILQKIFGLGK